MSDENIIAMSFGAAGFLFGLYNLFADRRLRRREFAWKRAEQAKLLIDEIFSNKELNKFFRILESVEIQRPLKFGSLEYNYNYVIECLKDGEIEGAHSKLEVYNIIDEFIYYFDRMEQLIQVRFIDFESVKSPFVWFMSIINKDKSVFVEYAESIGYTKFKFFVQRFS